MSPGFVQVAPPCDLYHLQPPAPCHPGHAPDVGGYTDGTPQGPQRPNQNRGGSRGGSGSSSRGGDQGYMSQRGSALGPMYSSDIGIPLAHHEQPGNAAVPYGYPLEQRYGVSNGGAPAAHREFPEQCLRVVPPHRKGFETEEAFSSPSSTLQAPYPSSNSGTSTQSAHSPRCDPQRQPVRPSSGSSSSMQEPQPLRSHTQQPLPELRLPQRQPMMRGYAGGPGMPAVGSPGQGSPAWDGTQPLSRGFPPEAPTRGSPNRCTQGPPMNLGATFPPAKGSTQGPGGWRPAPCGGMGSPAGLHQQSGSPSRCTQASPVSFPPSKGSPQVMGEWGRAPQGGMGSPGGASWGGHQQSGSPSRGLQGEVLDRSAKGVRPLHAMMAEDQHLMRGPGSGDFRGLRPPHGMMAEEHRLMRGPGSGDLRGVRPPHRMMAEEQRLMSGPGSGDLRGVRPLLGMTAEEQRLMRGPGSGDLRGVRPPHGMMAEEQRLVSGPGSGDLRGVRLLLGMTAEEQHLMRGPGSGDFGAQALVNAPPGCHSTNSSPVQRRSPMAPSGLAPPQGYAPTRFSTEPRVPGPGAPGRLRDPLRVVKKGVSDPEREHPACAGGAPWERAVRKGASTQERGVVQAPGRTGRAPQQVVDERREYVTDECRGAGMGSPYGPALSTGLGHQDWPGQERASSDFAGGMPAQPERLQRSLSDDSDGEADARGTGGCWMGAGWFTINVDQCQGAVAPGPPQAFPERKLQRKLSDDSDDGSTVVPAACFQEGRGNVFCGQGQEGGPRHGGMRLGSPAQFGIAPVFSDAPAAQWQTAEQRQQRPSLQRALSEDSLEGEACALGVRQGEAIHTTPQGRSSSGSSMGLLDEEGLGGTGALGEWEREEAPGLPAGGLPARLAGQEAPAMGGSGPQKALERSLSQDSMEEPLQGQRRAQTSPRGGNPALPNMERTVFQDLGKPKAKVKTKTVRKERPSGKGNPSPARKLERTLSQDSVEEREKTARVAREMATARGKPSPARRLERTLSQDSVEGGPEPDRVPRRRPKAKAVPATAPTGRLQRTLSQDSLEEPQVAQGPRAKGRAKGMGKPKDGASAPVKKMERSLVQDESAEEKQLPAEAAQAAAPKRPKDKQAMKPGAKAVRKSKAPGSGSGSGSGLGVAKPVAFQELGRKPQTSGEAQDPLPLQAVERPVAHQEMDVVVFEIPATGEAAQGRGSCPQSAFPRPERRCALMEAQEILAPGDPCEGYAPPADESEVLQPPQPCMMPPQPRMMPPQQSTMPPQPSMMPPQQRPGDGWQQRQGQRSSHSEEQLRPFKQRSAGFSDEAPAREGRRQPRAPLEEDVCAGPVEAVLRAGAEEREEVRAGPVEEGIYSGRVYEMPLQHALGLDRGSAGEPGMMQGREYSLLSQQGIMSHQQRILGPPQEKKDPPHGMGAHGGQLMPPEASRGLYASVDEKESFSAPAYKAPRASRKPPNKMCLQHSLSDDEDDPQPSKPSVKAPEGRAGSCQPGHRLGRTQSDEETICAAVQGKAQGGSPPQAQRAERQKASASSGKLQRSLNEDEGEPPRRSGDQRRTGRPQGHARAPHPTSQGSCSLSQGAPAGSQASYAAAPMGCPQAAPGQLRVSQGMPTSTKLQRSISDDEDSSEKNSKEGGPRPRQERFPVKKLERCLSDDMSDGEGVAAPIAVQTGRARGHGANKGGQGARCSGDEARDGGRPNRGRRPVGRVGVRDEVVT